MMQVTEFLRVHTARIVIIALLSIFINSHILPNTSVLNEVVYADECENSTC